MRVRSGSDKLLSLVITSAIGILILLLLAWMVSMTPQHVQAAAQPAARPAVALAGPDLTVELSLDPAAPGVGEAATLTVIYRNIGTSASGAATLHAYKDPVDQPPTGATTPNLNLGLAQIPGLGAGGSGSVQKTGITFDSVGCNHVIYVWIDRGNSVAEGNESNNLIALPVCVGVTCQADGYETDNLCSAAGWLVEGGVQARSLCHPGNATQSDSDWIKFTAFAGVTYTVGTANQGVHARPKVQIYNQCGGNTLAEQANNLTWQAPASGVYYANVSQVGAVLGPLSAYSLTLSSSTGVTDAFEPDNRCSDARDITTNGVRQTHRFQAPNDEDWVKFAIKAGESFIVIADNTGVGVNPIVTLFDSCTQVPAQNSLGQSAQQVAASSPTDRLYFARLTNQNPNGFGATAHYDLHITASACLADSLEKDDDAAQAKLIAVGEAAKTHNFCPASDADWIKFNAVADKIYVLQTANLAFAADTELHLYGPDGTTVIAQNDDYGYSSASRLVWKPTTSGLYYARVRHVNAVANGPNTQYEFSINEGFCQPDPQEGDNGDNGPGDAASVPGNGVTQAYNFCADPLDVNLGDQDWLRLAAQPGGSYQLVTTGLGPNSDPILELYAGDGATVLARNDDAGGGRSATLAFTPTVGGAYFVRVRQYNSTLNGNDASYNVQFFATEPPTPTPTPSPTPSPTPTPTPSPTPPPSTAKTLIVVNRARLETLYGAEQTATLMNKLLQLADDSAVSGLLFQVESDPAVAAAYSAWTADATTLADNDKANGVVAAIRNRLISFADNAPQLAYVIIVGDDRVIPFRRVLDRVTPQGPNSNSVETAYAPKLLGGSTVQTALAANMILTDDYLADREPSQWQDKQNNQYELYIADYGVGRLVETPAAISAFIDNFLAGDKIINTSKVLVTGYDFVQDAANIIKTLYSSDALTTDSTLIGPQWPGDDLRTRFLQAAPRFDIYAINGHSTHVAQGVPDEKDLTAGEVVTATTDLSGALIYSLGCHGGLNDPGVLDLPQAYLQKLANYVGNTGFGWGGGGIIYSEALMRNYSREILRDTKATIGGALSQAKKKYYSQAQTFNAYDAKILMQVTLYGLPMVGVTSGGSLTNDDPFPSAQPTFTPPTAFGDVAEGATGYQLPGSFGAFGEATSNQGVTYNLDDNVVFAAGEPVQPQYFANVSAPAAGELRGVVFLGGIYTDVVSFDPVIALADNEYITDKSEPTFSSPTFYPAIPFTIRTSVGLPGAADTVVMNLGQFKSNTNVTGAAIGSTGVNRIYDQMAFGTYYSQSPDRNAANILLVDGILAPTTNTGQIKVEARDASGVHRVVIAYTAGQGKWQSANLAFDAVSQKWTGVISGTVNTQFFVQVVDKAGNVAINDNKGRYYPLTPPLPLATGRSIDRRLYLPLVTR